MFFSLFLCLFLLTGCAARGDIVDWCAADLDGAHIVLLTGGGFDAELGRRFGDTLQIYDGSVLPEVERGVLPSVAPVFSRDMTDLKPLKVLAGDVTGDDVAEISVCVYKTAEFHPVMAMRPFFYGFADGALTPVWLGSRLARPFDDYTLADINDDGVDEILSIERLENDDRIVCAYNWKGFGFEELARSDSLKTSVAFVSPLVVRRKVGFITKDYALRLEATEAGHCIVLE